ncbi:MAG: hypothetical protein A2087_09810 [Spirochaetes bacterium GWD1_61_31]|nr:MAG: hypothetical protein A2Y37_12525 [Spirochaetes bacterium GWB1_60_80]OHD35657.1 MAG: hypothetical protein A2004_02120 [Spirochaetes bacterium GWC1_61_12]OHD41221.1 MAG: hypothetical protein A2087_09810 [Spirochaetes bacterium GWD1_61_31]OHD45115.1 MAG: hypothetical protein A2Y35_09580 [Spirochaetes bacterium GWE1_60_18]HAP43593.1 hypothetical protein [Spirochaetaceae bacterium]
MKRLDVPYSGVVALLQRAEFFSRLLPDDLYWLASHSGVYGYKAGDSVFAPGEPASRFYIVHQGSVEVCRQGADGSLEPMATFIDGDVLGDFDFARQASHDVRAVAGAATELLLFPDLGQSIDSIAAARPDISARLLLRAVSMISSRVRSTQMLISENAPWVRELRKQMYTDAATGLWQRSYLDEELPRKLLRATPVALLFMKPDRFKDLCDHWGHAAGDLAMARIAELLQAEAGREGGWAIRLRSNETALVIPRCTAEKAGWLAGRLVRAFAALRLDDSLAGSVGGFTVSMALGFWPLDYASFRPLVERTHACLMSAWQDGGDRIYRTGGRA